MFHTKWIGKLIFGIIFCAFILVLPQSVSAQANGCPAGTGRWYTGELIKKVPGCEAGCQLPSTIFREQNYKYLNKEICNCQVAICVTGAPAPYVNNTPFTFSNATGTGNGAGSVLDPPKCLSARAGQASTLANQYMTAQFVPGSTVYTVACIGSASGRVCSTGDSVVDKELFGLGVPSENQAAAGQINVKFYHADNTNVENPKFLVDETGIINVNAVVGGTEGGSGQYDFWGIAIRPVTDSSLAGMGSIQQATFAFDSAQGKKCVAISWAPPASNSPPEDPYGIIFDSVSLEPLGKVVSTIRNDSGVPLKDDAVLKNNTKTSEDGVFTYLVPAGKYLLTVVMPAGYQFSAAPHASPNMAQVYDFIDDNSAHNRCTLYQPNEVIVERGAGMPECRNIPLDPVSTTPTVKDPISMFYSFEKDSDKEVYTLKGKVSHALTTLVATQTVIGQDGISTQKIEIGRVESNHSGFYIMEFPISKVQSDSPIVVNFVKSSLMGFATKKTVATPPGAKTSLTLQPLPSYIEGYASDKNNQIVPNAIIQIRLKNGNGIYYQTTADANGYFFIASKNLPTATLNLEFYLNFIDPSGKNIAYAISDFARANRYYFTKEKINLLTGEKNGAKPTAQAVDKTALDIPSSMNNGNQGGNQQKNQGGTNAPLVQNDSTKQSQPTNPLNQQILIIVAALLVLSAIAAGAVFMMVKNKAPQQPTY